MALWSYEGTRIVTPIAAVAAGSPSVWTKETGIHHKWEKAGELQLPAGFKQTELSRNSARGKERADRPGASALFLNLDDHLFANCQARNSQQTHAQHQEAAWLGR